MSLNGWLQQASFFASAPRSVISRSCFRRNLALGLDFPVSLLSSFWQVFFYKQRRRGKKENGKQYDEARLCKATLRSIRPFTQASEGARTRSQLLSIVKGVSVNERFHALFLWAVAAEKTGFVEESSLRCYQESSLLYESAQSRNQRTDVIRFTRGCPIGVGGHNRAVKTFFGVEFHQEVKKRREK